MAKHKKFKQNDNNLAIAYYRFELADAKRRIRDAGCRICLVAEPMPDDSPESVLMETMMEGIAEFYSRQLSQNIRRGMAYNAEHALYNGHKVVDDAVAPFMVSISRATPTARQCSQSVMTSTREA